MIAIQTVALIGKGNVARALGRAWQNSGINIAAYCNRTAELPEGLEHQDALLTSDPSKIPSDVDAILVAVSDDAINDVIQQLPSGPLVIHFSGCMPNPLQEGGVLWPIQSIAPDAEPTSNSYPIALSCSSSARNVLHKFAQLIASELHELSEKERQTAHLTAVFAANFANHCFAIAQELCKRASLSWDLFQPIAEHIASQGFAGTSKYHQTGPAMRQDHSALDAHQKLLKEHPEFESLYQALTQSIQSFHHTPEKLKP